MPKRLIDDSLLNSPSLEVLSPRCQDAIPRFILLADDFGCFEVEPRILWAKGWPKRPDVAEGDVSAWLAEMAERQAVGLDGQKAAPVLMLWTHAGRRYAHLTGWFGPHGQKRRAEYDANAPAGTPGRHGSKRRTPAPPADLLAEVLAGNVRAIDGKPPGTDREETGNPESEKTNDFLPAREVQVSRQVPGEFPVGKHAFPAPAVPVAVAVPVARSEEADVADAPPPPPAVETLVLDTPPAPRPAAESPSARAAGTSKPKADPLRRSLSDALLAVGKEERGGAFAFEGPKDSQAITRLLGFTRDVEEHVRRFRLALRSPAVEYGYRVDSIAAFATSRIWNHFAAPRSAGPTRLAPLGQPGRS